jgi:hypothetical protein
MLDPEMSAADFDGPRGAIVVALADTDRCR